MINANNKSKPRPGALLGGLLLLGLLTLIIGGCGLGKRAYPEKRHYHLSPEFSLSSEFSGPAGPPPRPGLLLIGNIRASSALERSNLLYKVGENEFKSDFYHEFTAPSGQLWREALAAYLDERGPVSEVSLVSSFKMADWILDGFLMSQHADLTGPRPQAAVSLKLTVAGLKSAQRPIIFSKVYNRRRDLDNERPETFVRGLNLVMADIFQEFNQDLRRVSWTKASGGREPLR